MRLLYIDREDDMLLYTPPPSLSTPPRETLERVVRSWYLFYEVLSDDREFLHNILADPRHIREEEDGKDTGNTNETTEGCAKF